MTVDDLPDFDVKILRLEPGDVIALELPIEYGDISSDAAARLKKHAEEAFGCTVVVLSGGISIVAVRRPEPV